MTLIQTLAFGIDVPGYVTNLCATLFLGGITVLSIGVLGEYIGRIYMETKDRPIYILKYSNFESDKDICPKIPDHQPGESNENNSDITAMENNDHKKAEEN